MNVEKRIIVPCTLVRKHVPIHLRSSQCYSPRFQAKMTPTTAAITPAKPTRATLLIASPVPLGVAEVDPEAEVTDPLALVVLDVVAGRLVVVVPVAPLVVVTPLVVVGTVVPFVEAGVVPVVGVVVPLPQVSAPD